MQNTSTVPEGLTVRCPIISPRSAAVVYFIQHEALCMRLTSDTHPSIRCRHVTMSSSIQVSDAYADSRAFNLEVGGISREAVFVRLLVLIPAALHPRMAVPL